MNALDWNLDELVEKVMSDLRASAASPEQIGATLTRDFQALRTKTEVAGDSIEPPTDVLDVSERIVVAETARKLASGTSLRKWRFVKSAVITPSAVDELRRLGVEWTRGADAKERSSAVEPTSRATLSASNASAQGVDRLSGSKVAQASETTELLVAFHVAAATAAPRTILEYASRFPRSTQETFDCLKKTTKRVGEALAENPRLKVVISTRDVAIGSIWANRIPGVRAVVAFDVEQTRRDVAATNANALIVDAVALGGYRTRRALDFFTQNRAEK